MKHLEIGIKIQVIYSQVNQYFNNKSSLIHNKVSFHNSEEKPAVTFINWIYFFKFFGGFKENSDREIEWFLNFSLLNILDCDLFTHPVFE